MNKKIQYITLAALMVLPLTGCSSEDNPVTEKNWDNTIYFKSTDEQKQDTYYKPYSGYVGDPCRFLTPYQRISRYSIYKTIAQILLVLTTLYGR